MKISFRKKRECREHVCGNCSSCANAIKLTISDDYLCNHYGIVDEDYTCNHYKINRLIKRTPRNRNINTQNKFENKFTKEDFSLLQ